MITQATVNDIDAILEIENQSFHSDSFSRRQFLYLIRNSKGKFYVLKHEGKLLAYVSLLVHARRANVRIYSIAVHPEARGRGFAQQLIDQVKIYASQNGYSRISLEVKTSNRPAIQLYESNGFLKTGMRSNYYHDGSDACVMTLALPETSLGEAYG